MAAPAKKKLEVLFKAFFATDKSADSAIRAYLEEKIQGIKIKSIEVYTTKGTVKAVVTSNVAELLTSEMSEDFDPSSYKRKSFSFISGPPMLAAGNDSKADALELEMKGKELAEVRVAAKRLENELEATKQKYDALEAKMTENKKLADQALAAMAEKAKKQVQESQEVFQGQVKSLSDQLAELDADKGKLERKVKDLTSEIQILNQRLEAKSKTAIGSASQQVESLEALIAQNAKKFEEERQEMQDKLAKMSMNVLAEQDRVEKVIAKAAEAENLGKAVALLEKEKQELVASLEAKESDAATYKKKYEDVAGKIAGLEQGLKDKETEAAELAKKAKEYEDKANHVTRTVKALETSKALSAKEQEAREKKIAALETEKAELLNERDRLSAELKAAKQDGSQFTTERESLKQTATELQKSIKEKEETIRELKLQVKEKDAALQELEAEHKGSEKQVEELQKKLETAEKNCDTLSKQVKKLEKSDRSTEKAQSTAKQKIDSLENEVKRKEKDLKTSEEAREQSQRELIIMQAKYSSTEKALAAKNVEIQELKAKLANGESKVGTNKLIVDPSAPHAGTSSINSSLTSATADFSRKDSAEFAGELGKLRKELDEEKLHNAQLNSRYLETKEEHDREKAKAEQLGKELAEAKTQLGKLEEFSKAAPDLEKYKQEAEELRAECKKLRLTAEEGSSAMELVSSMQKQHELMVKENTELKASLFEIESAARVQNATATAASDKKKLRITEEIQQILAEVIYVYKTLGTNAKQFMMDCQAKKEKNEAFLSVVAEIESIKKREEQLAKLKELGNDVAFLRGFPLKPDSAKLMLDCLKAAAEQKREKMEKYDNEIAKFNTMISVFQPKLSEYEEKLAFYY